jgi:YD repeat-containing protein
VSASVELDRALPAGLSAAKDTPEARKEAAKQFEALLLGELMKAMRATASFGEQEGDAFARSSYEEMFDRALVESSAGGLGIAAIFEQQTSGVPGAGSSDVASRFATSDRGAVGRSRERALGVPVRQLVPSADNDSLLRSAGSAAYGSEGARERDGIDSAFAGAVPQPGLWPVDGGVQSSGYGFRTHPIHGDKRFHSGLDIAAPEGREIRAVQRGTVTYAQRHPGYGNMVEITHPDGIVTRYAHASRLHVRVGDVVDVGETIADVGSTGQSTGPHLHFEVRDGARRLDPESYLERLRSAAADGPAALARGVNDEQESSEP